jgi:hypothetical protein
MCTSKLVRPPICSTQNSNLSYRLDNLTFWVQLVDRSKVVLRLKAQGSDYMPTAQTTDVWFTTNPTDGSRVSTVRSLRLIDWTTTKQHLQFPCLNITCRDVKSFSKCCTPKRFGENSFIQAFRLKNANQKYFTQSPVQDSILYCKCKTQVYAS